MKIQGWKNVIAVIMIMIMVLATPVSALAEEAADTDVSAATVETQAVTDTTPDMIASENTADTRLEAQQLQNTAADTKSEKTVAKKTVKKKAVKKSAKKTKKTKKTYTKSELRLMSAIIFCEAGAEPYAGKLAVGIVVMNRKRSSKYPDTVKGVIYDKFQFSPVRSGALSRALRNYDAGKFTAKNHKDCIKAAKEVLEGRTSVKLKGKDVNMKSYLFFSVGLRGSRLKIAHHRFK